MPILRRELGPDAVLRLPDEADARELYALIAEDREVLAAWLPWAAEQIQDATLTFIRAVRDQVAAGNGEQSLMVVDGRLAGMVGMHSIDRSHGTTTLGYWIGTRFRGRGVVTSAVRAYTEYAFTDLGLYRVEIQAAVENHASRAVAERAGFREEGVRRGAERVGSKRHDLVVYGLLASDAKA